MQKFVMPYEAEAAAVQRERETLKAFQSSLSWRLTAPLRKVLDLLRRG